jgi:hypothetical protein
VDCAASSPARWYWKRLSSGSLSSSSAGSMAGWVVLAAFVQRRSWGLGLALSLQAAMVLGWFAHPALGGLGLVFVLVWGYLLYIRRAVSRQTASTSQS